MPGGVGGGAGDGPASPIGLRPTPRALELHGAIVEHEGEIAIGVLREVDRRRPAELASKRIP